MGGGWMGGRNYIINLELSVNETERKQNSFLMSYNYETLFMYGSLFDDLNSMQCQQNFLSSIIDSPSHSSGVEKKKKICPDWKF